MIGCSRRSRACTRRWAGSPRYSCSTAIAGWVFRRATAGPSDEGRRRRRCLADGPKGRCARQGKCGGDEIEETEETEETNSTQAKAIHTHVSSPDCQTKHTHTLIDKILIQEPIIRITVSPFPGVSLLLLFRCSRSPFPDLSPLFFVLYSYPFFFSGLFVPSWSLSATTPLPSSSLVDGRPTPSLDGRVANIHVVKLSPVPHSCSRYIRAGLWLAFLSFFVRFTHIRFSASSALVLIKHSVSRIRVW